MDWTEISQRIQAGEDERTEFGRFRSFSEKDWLESVCALANTQGGLVVLGVADDGRIDGVPMDAGEVQERLTNAIHNGLNAPVQARLGRHQDAAGWVHWVEVGRMRGPEPLRHRGRVLVRRGRANDEPTGSELQELYNTYGLVFTEERVVPGTSVDAIAPQAFRDYMQRKGVDLDAEPGLPLDTDLYNREVLGRDFDGALRATLFGLLCFGKDPQGYPPTRNLCGQRGRAPGAVGAPDAVARGGRGRCPRLRRLGKYSLPARSARDR